MGIDSLNSSPACSPAGSPLPFHRTGGNIYVRHVSAGGTSLDNYQINPSNQMAHLHRIPLVSPSQASDSNTSGTGSVSLTTTPQHQYSRNSQHRHPLALSTNSYQVLFNFHTQA